MRGNGVSNTIKKGFIIIIILVFLSSSIILYYFSQNTHEVAPQPELRVQGAEIYEPKHLSYYEIHTTFAEYYVGNDITNELRDTLVDNLMFQAGNQGYDNSSLLKAFNVVYSNWSERPTRIPCLVTFVIEGENITQIGIAFNRAVRFDEFQLYQDDIFVFSGNVLTESTLEECLQYSDILIYHSPPNPIIHYWGIRD